MTDMHRPGNYIRAAVIGGAIGCFMLIAIFVVGGAAFYLLNRSAPPPAPVAVVAPTLAIASPQPTTEPTSTPQPAPTPTNPPTPKPSVPSPAAAPAAAPSAIQGNFADASGQSRTILMGVDPDPNNPFFQVLGTNGRSCMTCHEPGDGWTISPEHIRARFDATGGTDPLFRAVDAANSPKADVSTIDARRAAYSLLLNKGLIRVEFTLPANTEFHLMKADDPYGYASDKGLSLFRRVLPTTNLGFLNTVTWDGRESAPNVSLDQTLIQQAGGGAIAFLQTTQALTPAQRQQIVTFEKNLYSAQVFDENAGNLYEANGHAGPEWIAVEKVLPGVNDPFGQNPTNSPFNPLAFNIFDPWMTLGSATGGMSGTNVPQTVARVSMARGEQIFNTKKFNITGVNGLNDDMNQPTIQGTCSTCHNTPNVGNHSLPLLLNTGVADGSRRTPDLPLYTFMNDASHEMIQTSDPGRAIVTGKWKDMGKFKIPILRDLAARAPYFHNGSAATLMDVVNFYNTRFSMGLTPEEKQDLVNFLSGL